uniref:Transmembrane protein n=1 Tax=Medicago truncatula TaxID=3880 RepID=I3SD05_MEDTR|nr:unknown [Medicago truncatula]
MQKRKKKSMARILCFFYGLLILFLYLWSQPTKASLMFFHAFLAMNVHQICVQLIYLRSALI